MMKKLLSFLTMFFMVFTTNAQVCPDNNHPHAIDLGLPSGTKWACCNVGADKPEGNGGYYAWGETEEKEAYNEVSYQYCTGEGDNGYGWYLQNTQYQDLGSDIAGTHYDVAHEKWGGSWVMPSSDRIEELFDNCTRTFTCTLTNGIYGLMFTSKTNGATIFMPASDYYSPEIGQYWGSTQKPLDFKWAYGFFFHMYDSGLCTYSHPLGLSVRPVTDETNRIVSISSEKLDGADTWHTIDGKTLSSKPTEKGIYIHNGKKVVIK